MDYKIELQNNNADLEAIINKVNALPDIDVSGGGGSVSSSMFSTSASGRVPKYGNGRAATEIKWNETTYAVGTIS